MTHTPGPWTQSMGLVSDTQGYCTDEAGFIATVHNPYVEHVTFGGLQHPMSLHETDKMAEANARLIAAAPDLLAALKEIGRACCDNLSLLPEDKQGIYAYLADVAREAIDKAQGE